MTRTFGLLPVAIVMALLAAGAAHSRAQELTGTKRIGPGGDYPTLADAVAALNAQGAGEAGVTFEISGGFHGIPPAVQASGTEGAPIRFRPAGGAVVLLDRWEIRGNHVIVRDLILNSTYGNALQILGDYNTVTGCTIAAGSSAAISINGGVGNRIAENILTLSHWGVTLNGSQATGKAFHNRVEGNIIVDCSVGISVNGNANDIARNRIELPDHVAHVDGVNVRGNYNRVHHNTIRFDNVGSTALGASSPFTDVRAIRVDGGYGTSVAFNSIRLHAGGGGTPTGAAFGILFNTRPSLVHVKNNVFYGRAVKDPVAGDSVVWFLAFPGQSITETVPGVHVISDHNCFYVDPAGTGRVYTAGYSGGGSNNYATIDDWRAAAGVATDVHSIAADPRFAADDDLHLQSDSPARDAGIDLPGSWVDGDGDLVQGAPDMGADEYVAPRLPGDGNDDGKVDLADYVILRGNWGRTSPEPLGRADGDYTLDGVVDTADYYLWRIQYGQAESPADGSGDGTVDAADYVVWRNNRGRTSPVPLTASDGDYNLDGVVDLADYLLWRANYGKTLP